MGKQYVHTYSKSSGDMYPPCISIFSASDGGGLHKKKIYPPHFNQSFLFACRMKEGFRRSSNCDEYDAYDVNSFIFIQIDKKERNVFIRNCFKTPSKISKRQVLDKICKKYDIYIHGFVCFLT